MLDKNYFLKMIQKNKNQNITDNSIPVYNLHSPFSPDNYSPLTEVEKSFIHVPFDSIFEKRYAVKFDKKNGEYYIIDDGVRKNVQLLRYLEPIFYARFTSDAIEPTLEKAYTIKYQDMNRVFHVSPEKHVPWNVKAQMKIGNVFLLSGSNKNHADDYLIESNRKIVPSNFNDGTFSFSSENSYYVMQKIPGIYIFDLLKLP